MYDRDISLFVGVGFTFLTMIYSLAVKKKFLDWGKSRQELNSKSLKLLMLTIASIFFTNDANKLVLGPIERMLEKVKLIAKNPLAASSDAVEDAGIYTMMHNKEV